MFIQDHLAEVVLGALILYILSVRYRKGIRNVPGPFLNSISSLPRMWDIYKQKHHEAELRLHKQYGRLVRVGPNTVIVSDPAAINQIYGIQSQFSKSRFYELSAMHDEEGLVPDPFVLTDRALHTRMKRNAANAYSLNGLVKMEPWLEPVTDRLLNLLDTTISNGHFCDLGKVMKDYAMDAVFALTFGRDFNYLESGDVLGMHDVLDKGTDYMAIFGQIPWIHKFLLGDNPLVGYLVFGNVPGMARMAKLAESELELGQSNTSKEGPLTFLQQLILNQTANPNSINNREISTHALGNISAGSDTTAIALRSVIYNILKHPESYKRLCKEVRENLTLPVSFAQANKLPYLTAVIREAMRLHPSVGMILARLVPAGGATINEYQLPAGTEVGISPWVLHRDPEVFPDSDSFLPERWLESESTQDHLREMNRSFLAFGHGVHTCSGRWISLMEISKVVPTLLLRYNMELVDDGKDYEFKNLWFTSQKGLLVSLTKRDI